MKSSFSPTDLLEQMVAIDSTSGGEAELAAFLVETMNGLGFDAHIDEAGNAVGVKEAQDAGPDARELVLLGHMDTVPGEVPRKIEAGKLYGRGAVDAKGPLATFILAAARATPAPGTRLVVVGAVEEECATSKGARYRATFPAPEACIIGEPSGWDAITLGYKGCLHIEFDHAQDCGHGAGPQGTAAERCCEFWQSLKSMADRYNRDHDRLFDQLLPTLSQVRTTSDGLIDRVHAKMSVRLPPNLDTAALRDELASLAGEATLRFSGEEPAWTSPRTSPLARAFVRALREAGTSPRLKHKTGTSDMNILGPAWQCPILAYGPGDSLLDHTPNEHIELDEFERAIDVLQCAIETAGFAIERPLASSSHDR